MDFEKNQNDVREDLQFASRDIKASGYRQKYVLTSKGASRRRKDGFSKSTF